MSSTTNGVAIDGINQGSSERQEYFTPPGDGSNVEELDQELPRRDDAARVDVDAGEDVMDALRRLLPDGESIGAHYSHGRLSTWGMACSPPLPSAEILVTTNFLHISAALTKFSGPF